MPPLMLALEANITASATSTHKESGVSFVKRAPPSASGPETNANIWRILGPIIGSIVVLAFAVCAFFYARRLRKKRKRLTVTTKYLERREVLAADLREEPPHSPVQSSTGGHTMLDHQWEMLTPPPVITTSSPPRPLSLPTQMNSLSTSFANTAIASHLPRAPLIPPPLPPHTTAGDDPGMSSPTGGIAVEWRLSRIPTTAMYDLKSSRASTDIMYGRNSSRPPTDASFDRRPSRPSVEIVLEYRPPKAVQEAEVLGMAKEVRPPNRNHSRPVFI